MGVGRRHQALQAGPALDPERPGREAARFDRIGHMQAVALGHLSPGGLDSKPLDLGHEILDDAAPRCQLRRRFVGEFVAQEFARHADGQGQLQRAFVVPLGGQFVEVEQAACQHMQRSGFITSRRLPPVNVDGNRTLAGVCSAQAEHLEQHSDVDELMIRDTRIGMPDERFLRVLMGI